MEFQFDSNRIYVEDESNHIIAEITFPEVDEGVVTINRTFVDDSLRGRGIAGKLLFEAAGKLRAEGKKVIPGCTYAISWFEKHPEYADIVKK